MYLESVSILNTVIQMATWKSFFFFSDYFLYIDKYGISDGNQFDIFGISIIEQF